VPGEAQLSPRDRAIIETVRSFRQLSARHIEQLFFADGSPASRSGRARRTLRRLVARQALGRIQERSIGGWANGSQGYVYVPPRSVANIRDPHTLQIAELFVRLRTAERQGLCQLIEFEPEAKVDGHAFIPDAEVQLRVGGRRRHVFVEIDQGTESKARLAAKLAAYEAAYHSWTKPVFPRVVFYRRRQQAARPAAPRPGRQRNDRIVSGQLVR
jgi:hypothetical protein